MKHKEDDEVLAKDLDTGEFHKAKIIGISGNKYIVLFNNGEESLLKETEVKSKRTSRSATRTESRGRKKSPGRQSPGRSPGRPSGRRSPGRSPARSPKDSAQGKRLPNRQTTKLAKVSVARLDIKEGKSRKEESQSQSEDERSESSSSKTREIAPTTRRSIRLLSHASKVERDLKLGQLSKGMERAVSLPTERGQNYDFLGLKERGSSLQRDQMKNWEGDFSDADDHDKRKKTIDYIQKPREWGGWFGALFLIALMPLGMILPELYFFNLNNNNEPLSIPLERETYFSLESLFIFGGTLLLVALASYIPIGKLAEGQQTRSGVRQMYRLNGFLAAILVGAVYSYCLYYKRLTTDIILDHCLPIQICGFITALLLSIVLYVKALRAPVAELNIHATTSYEIYNFWQGKQTTPQILKLDVKFLIFRFALIASFLLNVTAVVKSIEEADNYKIDSLNLPLLAAFSMHALYLVPYFVVESEVLTSFEFMYEGTGYMMCMQFLLFPTFFSLPIRYLLNNRFAVPLPILALLSVTFMIGFTLYRLSNAQKNEFRRNPLSKKVSHLETIPTGRGKRLIVSGLWGTVRHPNYLGDLIMLWSLAAVPFKLNLFTFYPALVSTLVLVYRAIRDNKRCQARYGPAWDEYCSRVKYMIVPRVF